MESQTTLPCDVMLFCGEGCILTRGPGSELCMSAHPILRNIQPTGVGTVNSTYKPGEDISEGTKIHLHPHGARMRQSLEGSGWERHV